MASDALDAEGDYDNEDGPDDLDTEAVEPDRDEYMADELGDDIDELDDDTPRAPRLRNSERRRPERSSNIKSRKDPEPESDSDSPEESQSDQAEGVWEADEDVESDVEEQGAEMSRCVFCEQTEDKDPSEDFEEMLTCGVCKDHAHRQCARDNHSEFSEDEPDTWRCPECLQQGVEPGQVDQTRSRQQSSAPRMLRDLLPVIQSKTGSHTIFGAEIYDDNHKTRHKRKASTEMSRSETSESRKRIRSESSTIVLTHRNPSVALPTVSPPATPPSNQISQAGTPNTRSTRVRQRRSDKPLLTKVLVNEDQCVISFNLGASMLSEVHNNVRKQKRRERDRKRREKRSNAQQVPVKIHEVSHYPALQSSSFMNALFEMHDREGDQSKMKPYGGILNENEADTTRTFPQLNDRKKFESARMSAEDEWKKKLEAAAAEQARLLQKPSGPPGKIKCIHFGGFEIDTWHSSPYPEEYSQNRVLHVCEFCLKYMNSDFVAWRHKLKCPARHPPGDEIYHDENFSFFEVDGRKDPVYCQNLCLLAKLFLGSKTLYFDVEPFLFYVMTENNEQGCHFVGYFSKEKRSSSQNNVSCILVLPIHQRRGFGHMLIDFSYLLTRVEEKTGSPEKPLSDMGLVSYRSYWRLIMCSRLLAQKDALSITDLSQETGMTPDDVVCALEGLRALVRDPLTKAYALRLDYPFYEQFVQGYEKKNYPKINPSALMWVPYIMGRNNSHYENTHIQTVAQREDETGSQPPEEGVQLAQNDVATRDFAESKSKTSFEDEANAETNHQGPGTESTATPFPEPEQTNGSPSKQKEVPVTPTGHFTNAFNTQDSPIPATRYEVFPPLPGTQRKKGGRPPRPASARRGTPLRRGQSQADTPGSASKPSTGRRTRSALFMVNGDGDVNGNADDDGDKRENEGEDAQMGEGEVATDQAPDANDEEFKNEASDQSDGDGDAEGERDDEDEDEDE